VRELGTGQLRVVRVDRREVREDARSVDPLPLEAVVRKLVDLVPRDLLRQKVVGAGGTGDLGQRSAVAERVGQPDLARLIPELLQEEALARDELARHRLGAGHVGVRFDPHPADRHEPALGNPRPDALEQLRIELLHPRELLG
jgi:hypothetical protein